MKEVRVYVINLNTSNFMSTDIITDEEFIEEAEFQGSVYSLDGFQRAFNSEEINSNTHLIRII